MAKPMAGGGLSRGSMNRTPDIDRVTAIMDEIAHR